MCKNINVSEIKGTTMQSWKMEVAASRDVLVIIKFIQRQTVITQGEQENIYIYIYIQRTT